MKAHGAAEGGRKLCRCGCPREMHEHYRSGTDCATCPCPRYRRRWWR